MEKFVNSQEIFIPIYKEFFTCKNNDLQFNIFFGIY